MKYKNKYMAFASITVLSVAAGAFVCLSNGNNQTLKNTLETKAASGPTQASSVPTTNIDLNDSTDSEIRNYYSSLNSISDTNEKRGTNLLKNLRTIIHNFEYFTYDQVWKIYEITDREWELSPAASNSSVGITYNSSSNVFTKYTYGSSTSSTGSNPYVHTLYRNRDSNGVTTQYARIREWDSHDSSTYAENTMYSGMTNREHVWCQSRGFKASSGATGPAGTDIHHLMSGDGYVNQQPHNNNPYGYVKTATLDASSKVSWLSGNLKGAPKTTSSLDESTVVFEPQDSDKGDIARACFYMAACYNNYSGNETISNYDPNLVMADYATDSGSSEYSSSTKAVGMGILSDLLEWHKLDPVDEYEIHRNNLIYKNYQKNRNPFIDFPEWVDYIWGNKSGYAKPSSDTINGYNDGSSTVVAVTGVSVTPATVSVAEGSTTQLTAAISPSNATNQGITWSSNSANATVNSNGVVTGVSAGTATITATTSDGGFTDTCTVTITESQGGGGGGESEQTISGNIGTYASEHSWSNGTKYTSIQLDDYITASVKTGSGNTGKYYTSGYEWRFYQTENAALEISAANGATLNSVKLTYNVANTGILLDSSSNVLASDTEKTVSGTSATFTVGNSGSATNGQVKFTNIEVKYSLPSTVAALSSITLDTSNVKTDFYAGDTFNYDNLVVTANYDDESSKTVTPSSVSSPDMSTTGNKTITVTYTEGGVSKTATYTINVLARVVTSISASVDKTYHPGETISVSDINVINNLGEEVTTFTFDNDGYQFTYNDAASGGALTNKTFANAISASGKTCSLTVQVQRIKREDVISVSDTLNQAFTGVTGSNYTSWNSKAAPNSSAVYAGHNAGSNSSIQLRSKATNNNTYTTDTYSGIVTTVSGGPVLSIKVVWNSETSSGQTLNIYGKNTAYDTPNDLYNESTRGTLLGTIVNGTSTELTVSGTYTFVGIRSASGAMYLTSVDFTYGIDDSATNVANYIMYEDTNGQCNSKFTVAKGYFEGLSKSERSTFMSSNDYVISTARTRLEDWASYLGKTITYSDGDYVISSVKNISFNADGIVSNDSMTLVVVLSSVLCITVGGYFLLKKRKER